MPRKKKGGQSPARVPSGLSAEGGSLCPAKGYRPPVMGSSFVPGASLSTAAKMDIVRSMQEMFSHLDPEVIDIVLSECDFKVENAMDSLLELSVAATDPQPISAPVSGFERTAAELLTPHHFAEPSLQTDILKQPQLSCTSPNSFMTEDLDFLIDQEVQSLSAQEDAKGGQLGSQLHKLPEALKSNLESQDTGPSVEESNLERSQTSSSSSPLDQLTTFGLEDIQGHVVLEDTHLTTETAVDKKTPSLDHVTSGHSSAFQLYTKQKKSNSLSEPAQVMSSDTTTLKPQQMKVDSSVPLAWNIKAPIFYPQVQGPAFVTPVVSNWPREQGHGVPWQRPVSQASLRPNAAMPRSWILPSTQPPGQYSRLRLEGKVLVLLRGAPGSGKSTLARALSEHNPGGVVLSTDDYFKVGEEYHFDPTVLGEAHSWNHNRARLAFERGDNPIIIDNTNMHGWEMKPYVVQALKHNYKVLFREPDTWWKTKPKELERRTMHRVPLETIRRMLCGYEHFVSVKSIMGSQLPGWKRSGSEVGSCPDLVGEPSEKNNKSHVVSSLPDVSTTLDSKYFGNRETLQENEDTDMGDLDLELDRISKNQAIPDCIVESIINKDHCNDELPIAFFESIGQRVKRKIIGKRPSLESGEPVDVAESTCNSEHEGVPQQTDYTGEVCTNSAEVKMFEFEGDWPSSGSLHQRQARRQCRQYDTGNKSEEANELHTLLDVIQTSAAPIYTDCSTLSALPPSSVDELNTDVKTEGSISENEEQHKKEYSTTELPDCVSDLKPTENTLVREKHFNLNADVVQRSTESHKEKWVKEELDSGEVCESPKFETLVETESMGDVSGSQDRKQRQNRRSGKQCKLALTFTQNCPESSMDFGENTAAAAHTDDEPIPEPKPHCRLCTELTIKPDREGCLSSFTQTESKDFALLWRVNHQNNPDTCNLCILCGDPTRFVPESSGDTAIQATKHKDVPYYVVHESSTQVEEKELGSALGLQENLHILKSHFKLVTLDTLEDLYEKCQQDLEWTTNLLLDSGERFFRDDEGEEEEIKPCIGSDDEPAPELSLIMSNIVKFEEPTCSGPDVVVEEIQHLNSIASVQGFNTNNDSSTGHSILDDISVQQEKSNNDSETIRKEHAPVSENKANLNQNTQLGITWPQGCEGEVCGGMAGAERIQSSAEEIEDESSSMGEVHRLLQAELDELEREEKDREKARKKNMKKNREHLMDIKSVELKLPTELALQLTELFGSVGIDPDSPEDYVLQMDLNLAKLLHQKWKESVQERQKQAALSFHLLQESSAHWGKSQQWAMKESNPLDGNTHLDSHADAGCHLPFMDHWNVSQPHVSLRDIIKEELALQKNRDKARQSRADMDKRDGATLLKEDQLFTLFPTIDRHFLQDIFRDHNYSLTQTELFLRSLLDEGPVKTVVAPEASPVGHPRAASKDRDKKPVNSVVPGYQDTEDPEYQDFRAEANLQRRRQLENFAKAAEAYKQGHKEVASFYAQQGHLHGQRMREANHRAAVQIFERVNSSLLPQNILDLHGLHVSEALEHLMQVLEKKTTECEQGLCRPQLSVITGRGNHSQGGVARIRPAVIDYLTNKHYRFTEPKPGLVLVSLK